MFRIISLGATLALASTTWASVSIGTITVTELINNCTAVGQFQSSDVLELKVPITNNEGVMSLFRVLVRMRATNATGETVDANYTGPMRVQTLPSAQGWDDSYGLVFNTPAIANGATYTVTARLGLHNQFLGAIGIANNGSGVVNVDVEVYRYDMAGAAGFLAAASTPITVYRRNSCGNSTSGTIVTDRAVYDNVGDTVTVEWGAAGCDARPAFAEESAATVVIRRMAGVPSGDPVADFNGATDVASISTWNVYDMPDDGCVVDEGVSRTFCYNDQIGAVQSVSLYNTYTTQAADVNKYLIVRLPIGAGTASHPVREAQYNYFFVGNPVPIELESFHGHAEEGRIRLTWTTASELDNLGFLVYRSDERDGEYVRLVHDLIPGAGTTQMPQGYGFVDTDVKPGATYWYMLSDVSTQGVEKFHGPIAVSVPASLALDLSVENPARRNGTVSFSIPEAGATSLTLYDMAGRGVITLAKGSFAAGRHTVSLPAKDQIRAGVYVLRLRSSEGTISKKISLMD